MIRNPLSKIVEAKGWCVADGATGTNLFSRGLETGYPPELWSVERPDDVLWLHNGFLQAGSDLILTNSFGGTGSRLKLHNAQDRTRALNIAAGKLARRAVDAQFSVTGKKAIVAGSIGPTGELFEPFGRLNHSSALADFSEQVDALAEGGVDLLWIETMSSNEEVAALDNTPPRDFDEAAMVAALGEAWADVKIDNGVRDDRRKRRGRHRHT